MAIRLVIIAAACLAYLVPLPGWWVERYYSRAFYAAVQPVVTSISNTVPTDLFGPLLTVVFVLLVLALWRSIGKARRAHAWKPVAHVLLNCAAAASLVYLLFLACWGLNYERVPLSDRLVANAETVRPDALRALGNEAANQLNQLHAKAHAEQVQSWSDLRSYMTPAFARTYRALAPGSEPLTGVPKWSLLTYYFERAGISGMTDPFFLEILVDRSLLPYERPFVVAHEWAHLAGYADEAEANFAGWITCMNGGSFAAYSGWLFMYGEVLAAVPRSERAQLVRALADGPRADLGAITARERRIAPVLQAASWRVYDRYLKANRVEEGVASYDRVLMLVLRSRFGPGWMPVLKEGR